jgi:hypothetical protein
MTPWSGLLAALGIRQVSMREVRAEAFFLGNRHKGEIVAGARKELRGPELDANRAALLRAVIRMAPNFASEGHGHDG